MTRLILVFFAALTLSPALAQQDRMPSFVEMQRRMMDMQQRMIQQLQDGGSWGNGSFRQDTSFFFQFDTTFSGDMGSGGRMHFFRSSPFGNDTTRVNPGGLGDFWGFDRMLQDFFNFDNPDSGFDMGDDQMPQDDGNMGRTEDDLLPEERLRQQEQAAQQKSPKTPPVAPKAKDKKRKVETIRI